MSHTHPSPSDWVQLLYDECDDPTRAALQEHLKDCSECRTLVRRWAHTASLLDEWKLPEKTQLVAGSNPPAERESQGERIIRFPYVRTAVIAAVCSVVASFCTTWFHPDAAVIAADVRRALLPDVQGMLQSELVALQSDSRALLPLIHDESGKVAAATMAGWIQEDQERRAHLQRALRDLLENQLLLRQDLETLAVEAQARILQTRRELLRLNSDLRQEAAAGTSPLVDYGPPFGSGLQF